MTTALANMYKWLEKLTDTKREFLHVNNQRKGRLRPTTFNLLSATQNLVTNYDDLGKLDETARLYQVALKGFTSVCGDKSYAVLNVKGNPTSLHSSQGRHAEAEALGLEAYEGRYQMMEPRDPRTLLSLSDLSVACVAQSKCRQANRCATEAIAGSTEVKGPNSGRVLLATENLASAESGLGHCAEVIILSEHAWESRCATLRLEHLDTLHSRPNLTIHLHQLQRYDDANPMELEVVRASTKLYGPDRPKTLFTLDNLAAHQASQYRYDESIDLHLRVLENRKRLLGKFHNATLLTMNKGRLNVAKVSESSKRASRYIIALYEPL